MISGSRQSQKQSLGNSNPNKALQQAIEDLHHFTCQNASLRIPRFDTLELSNGALVPKERPSSKLSVKFIPNFLSSIFSSSHKELHEKKRNEIQEKILRAIDIIKDRFGMIRKLQKGTPAEQKLAETALSTIENFNAIIQKTERLSLSNWFAQLVYDTEDLSRYKIEVPPATVSNTYLLPVKELTHTLNNAYPQLNGPTRQEADAFRMKAISLMKSHLLPVQSIRNAMRYIREAPITPHSKESLPFGNANSSSIISFSQTLMPFPGEIIELEGSFRRTTSLQTHSTPIPSSFRMLSMATQTGYPHPSQHTGAAFSDKILPQCPHRLSMLPLLNALYQKKWETARALLPAGRLNTPAKQILENKQKIFENNLEEHLNLHQKLVKAIATGAGQEIDETLCQQLFHQLETADSPYASLSLVYQMIGTFFINRPYDRLQEEWLEKGNNCLYAIEPEARLEEACSILNDEHELVVKELNKLIATDSTSNKPFLEFTLQMGSIIAPTVRTLILQQMAEKLEYEAPVLNAFAKRIQAAALFQLNTFLNEFENSSFGDDYLLRLLEEEIAIFSGSEEASSTMPIVLELENYSKLRFQQIQEKWNSE